MNLRRCFKVLKLSASADAEAVKRSHRRLSAVWHPDRNVRRSGWRRRRAERRMREINAARDTLLAHIVRGPEPTPAQQRPDPVGRATPPSTSPSATPVFNGAVPIRPGPGMSIDPAAARDASPAENPAPPEGPLPEAMKAARDADAWWRLGHLEKAVFFYDSALKLDPTFALAFNNRGVVFRGLERTREAIADFTQAIAIDPVFVDAYFNRGRAYYEIGEHRLALADFDQVIALAPDRLVAYKNRARVYRKLGRHAQAMADLARVVRHSEPAVYTVGANRLR